MQLISSTATSSPCSFGWTQDTFQTITRWSYKLKSYGNFCSFAFFNQKQTMNFQTCSQDPERSAFVMITNYGQCKISSITPFWTLVEQSSSEFCFGLLFFGFFVFGLFFFTPPPLLLVPISNLLLLSNQVPLPQDPPKYCQEKSSHSMEREQNACISISPGTFDSQSSYCIKPLSSKPVWPHLFKDLGHI